MLRALVLPILILLFVSACSDATPSLPGPSYVEAGMLIHEQSSVLKVDNAPATAVTMTPEALAPNYEVALRVYWSEVAGAQGYSVYLREGEKQTLLGSSETASTQFLLKDLNTKVEVGAGAQYQVGVAALQEGREGAVTWSWTLEALGEVRLNGPPENVAQEVRPTFTWTNAVGRPTRADLVIYSQSGLERDRMSWTGESLPESFVWEQGLFGGDYSWAVRNYGAFKNLATEVRDERLEKDFPEGYMVMTVPQAKAFSIDGPSGGEFDIEFLFGSGVSETQKQVFLRAAERWESVISGDLTDIKGFDKAADECISGEPAFQGDVDDLLIFADVVTFADERILGQAGPCYLRSSGDNRLLSFYGVMRFNARYANDADFESTVLHEMGHVFGIGTLWEFGQFDLLEYSGSDCQAASSIGFSGAEAVEAYGVLGGSGFVPVENSGGAGTKCGHWDEETFDNELMTGYSEGGNQERLSAMTIASLEDMGYTVNRAEADVYELPDCSPTCTARMRDLPLAEREILLTPRLWKD